MGVETPPQLPLAAFALRCGVPFTGSERLAGWQCLRHKFIGNAFRFVFTHKRPQADAAISAAQSIVGKPQNWACYREILSSVSPRNDKSDSLCASRITAAIAATAYGAHRAPLQTQLVHTVFTAAGTDRQCLPGLLLPTFGLRNDKSGTVIILSLPNTNRQHCAGPGCPLPYSALREAMGKTPLSTLNFRRPAGGYPRTGISSNPGRAPMPRRGSDCSRPDCAPQPPRATARCPAA